MTDGVPRHGKPKQPEAFMNRAVTGRLIFLVALLAALGIACTSAGDQETNPAGLFNSFVSLGPSAGRGNDTAADDDGSGGEIADVIVLPPPEENPLSRVVVVSTAEACSLSGEVTADGESGRLPSQPRNTPIGRYHVLRFVGLWPEGVFHYALRLAGEKLVAAGSFTTPPLPSWAPVLTVLIDESDHDIWLAGAFNTPGDNGGYFGLKRAIVVFDQQGRPRFFHETPPELGEPTPPNQGLRVLPSGEMAWSDTRAITAVNLAGRERRLFDLGLAMPLLQAGHHEFILNETADEALILTNRLGSGVKCDLRTPTDRAVGDGWAIIAPDGEIRHSWSVFDHQDLIPPDRMNHVICHLHFFGAGTYDYTHANSIVPLPDGRSVLLSLRNTMEIVKIDIETGEIIWRMGPGLDFAWEGAESLDDPWFHMQHDVKWLPGNFLLMFDNANCHYDGNCFHGDWSRALLLAVDEERRVVRPVWEHRVPFSQAMGNVEPLPNGNGLIFTGWQGYLYEVTPDHRVVFSCRWPFFNKSLNIRYFPALWEK